MKDERKEALIRKYSYAAQQAQAKEGKGPGGPGPGHGPGRGRMPGGKPRDTGKTIKRLLSYIREDKYKLVLVFACVIINTVSMLAGSYMLRPIINSLTSSEGSAQKLLHSPDAHGWHLPVRYCRPVSAGPDYDRNIPAGHI